MNEIICENVLCKPAVQNYRNEMKLYEFVFTGRNLRLMELLSIIILNLVIRH